MTQLIKKLSEARYLLLIGIIYTSLITVAFLYPTEGLPKVTIPASDKIVHILIHGLLAFIWLTYSYSADKYHISNKIVVVVLIVCFLYGLVIEVSQHWFTLSRQFDLLDILANTVGSLIGLLFFWIFRRLNIL
tara:strand:- start:26649 stop:27047 length:399 start_codon:yes stop_codon:yes gene_type:complete